MAAMLASCSEVVETQQVEIPESHEAAIAGQTPVLFGAYTTRNITRGGVTGTLSDDAMRDVNNNKFNDAGFGVFGYYTDAQDYSAKSVPNFMYNQQVKYNPTTGWNYEPVKYWPNEYGDQAASADQDKVSFFAYAPHIDVTDPAKGTVADATWGITGLSKNTATGDPLVKYISSFNLAQQVDLCWGTVDATTTTWATIQGANQTFTAGKPWIDVEHPALIDQKMKFNFRHALAQLNLQIDVDADLQNHGDNDGKLKDGTKVYVRSITLGGIVQKAALNLNNETANTARWMSYDGQSELTASSETYTIHDGRKDGKEGVSAATGSEKITGLNATIISDTGNTSEGVTDSLKNLFAPQATIDGVTQSAEDQLKQPVFVIPANDEPLTITIVYDVETEDSNLAGVLSDGTTKGSSIENRITKEITFGSTNAGVRSGSLYTVKLHLGMNSVKFDAEVSDWANSASDVDVWAPGNQGEGEYNPANPLTLTQTKINGTAKTLTGLTGAQATSFTMIGSGEGSITNMQASKLNTFQVREGTDVVNISKISAHSRGFMASLRALTRAEGDTVWTTRVENCQYILIKALKKGKATIAGTDQEGNTSTIVITVDDSEMYLDQTKVTMYNFKDKLASDSVFVNINFIDAVSDSVAKDKVDSVVVTKLDSQSQIFTAKWYEGSSYVALLPDSVGTNTFTVYSHNGKTATCTVTVAQPKITVNNQTIFLKGGAAPSASTLTYSTTPAEEGVNITWPENAAFKKTESSGSVKLTGMGTEDKKDSIMFTFKNHPTTDTVYVYVDVQANDPGKKLSDGGKSIRQIICSDTDLTYPSTTEAKLWGHTPIAMITYVGSAENPADTTKVNGKNFTCLAMALSDAGRATWYATNTPCRHTGSTFVTYTKNNYGTMNGISETNYLTDNADHVHNAAVMAKNYSTKIGTGIGANSGWFLPSIGQWNLMVKNAFPNESKAVKNTDGSDVSDVWDNNIPWWSYSGGGNPKNVGYTANVINDTYLTPAGVNGLQSYAYWSSSENSASYAWGVNFYYCTVYSSNKTYNYYVRPVLAF